MAAETPLLNATRTRKAKARGALILEQGKSYRVCMPHLVDYGDPSPFKYLDRALEGAGIRFTPAAFRAPGWRGDSCDDYRRGGTVVFEWVAHWWLCHEGAEAFDLYHHDALAAEVLEVVKDPPRAECWLTLANLRNYRIPHPSDWRAACNYYEATMKTAAKRYFGGKSPIF